MKNTKKRFILILVFLLLVGILTIQLYQKKEYSYHDVLNKYIGSDLEISKLTSVNLTIADPSLHINTLDKGTIDSVLRFSEDMKLKKHKEDIPPVYLLRFYNTDKSASYFMYVGEQHIEINDKTYEVVGENYLFEKIKTIIYK